MYKKFWSGNWRVKSLLEYMGKEGRILLMCILRLELFDS
jgi:hypothetical protein